MEQCKTLIMEKEDNILINRFHDLARLADSRNYRTFSDFLTLAEQSLLSGEVFSVPVTLYGGYETAERKVAFMGDFDEDDCPVCIIEIAPVMQKFANTLTHRDFLGALMSLGIRREMLGDIIISENKGYLFCLETVADFITENLDKIKHTTVRCVRTDTLPCQAVQLPEPEQIVVASERLDVLVAAVYNLSRTAARNLFLQKNVFVDSRLAENPSRTLSDGQTVSVRGYGRFIYEKAEGETRKGRLRVSVRVFR